MGKALFGASILFAGFAFLSIPGCGGDDGDGGGTGGSGGGGGSGGAVGGAGGGGGSGGGSGGAGGGGGGDRDAGGGGTGGGTAGPTFAQVQAILTNTKLFCSGCHDGTSAVLPQAFNVKSHKDLLANSIQCMNKGTPRQRVKPGDAANSYLIHKVRGIMLCDGRRMPVTADQLTEEQIKTLEDWINAGAKMD